MVVIKPFGPVVA